MKCSVTLLLLLIAGCDGVAFEATDEQPPLWMPHDITVNVITWAQLDETYFVYAMWMSDGFKRESQTVPAYYSNSDSTASIFIKGITPYNMIDFTVMDTSGVTVAETSCQFTANSGCESPQYIVVREDENGSISAQCGSICASSGGCDFFGYNFCS